MISRPAILAPILFVGAQHVLAQEQQAGTAPVVSEIHIEGTKFSHPERIRFRLKSRAGSPLDLQDVADDVRTINTMDEYTDGASYVEYLDDDHIRLIYRVRELPRIRKITFTGLGYWGRQGLDDQIASKEFGYLNPLKLNTDERILIRYYEEKGYRNIKVDVTVNEISDGAEAEINYHVTLGRYTKIARTHYHNMPSGTYKQQADARLLFNRIGQPFNEDLLALDHNSVIRYLQDMGYLDAQVSDPQVLYYDSVDSNNPIFRNGPQFLPGTDRHDRVVLKFDIEGGDRYKLGNVFFSGNTVLSEEELREEFAMPSGSWFKAADVSAAVARARLRLRNLGYAQGRFLIDERPNVEDRTVDLTIQVIEGGIYDFGRIDVSGNYRTKDAAIRRLIYMEPSQQFTQDAVNESRRQLSRTGLFRLDPGRAIQLIQDYPPDRPEQVDYTISLDEGDTASLNAQLGFSTSGGFFGRLEFTERNFDLLGLITEGRWRGSGQSFRTGVQVGEELVNFNINWVNPHMWDSPYFLRTSFNRSDEDSSRNDWEELRSVVDTSVGRYFLKRDLQLSLGYRYTDRTISNVSANASDDVVPGDSFSNSLYLNQTLDKLDNRILPTSGGNLRLTQRIVGGPLSSTDNFYELRGVGAYYQPLRRADLGGVTYLKFVQTYGQLGSLESDVDVPFYARYRGGGPAPEHRGFERGDLGPLAINSSGNLTREGGTTEWLSTIELSVPVQGTNTGFRIIAFADHGNIWAEDEDVDFGDMYTAVGMGFRFPPSLPISLDFSWRLANGNIPEDNIVHFNISSSQF